MTSGGGGDLFAVAIAILLIFIIAAGLIDVAMFGLHWMGWLR